MHFEFDKQTDEYIKKAFVNLPNEVELLGFTADRKSCTLCTELDSLLTRLTAYSEKIKTSVGLSLESEKAREFDVVDHPATVVCDARDFRVKFYGVPSGLEIPPFIDTIVKASTLEPDLPEQQATRIENDRVNIRVFTLPTCTFCPGVVRAASDLRILNTGIEVEVIDASAFRNLTAKYSVSGVPFVVINDTVSLYGPSSKGELISTIKKLK
jgi:glutaredoxin-like protein